MAVHPKGKSGVCMMALGRQTSQDKAFSSQSCPRVARIHMTPPKLKSVNPWVSYWNGLDGTTAEPLFQKTFTSLQSKESPFYTRYG
ncbi:hypothetical protein Nmel_000205 [Mimus melanotis]